MDARVSSSMPTVMNSDRNVRVGSRTPSAQKRAPTSSRADSAMRRSTNGRLRSELIVMTASSRRRSWLAPTCSIVTGSSIWVRCVRKTGAMTRVFLLDDHEIVRRGLRELLETEDDLEVVGEASTAAEALARIPATRPEIAVLDVRLPDGSGVEVCRDIRSEHPEVQCIMLTSYADDEALFDAIMAGAAGYVLKQVRGTELLDGIRRVAAGQSLLDPSLTSRVLERLRHAPEEDERFTSLTDQEKRILTFLAEGMTNRQI